MKPTEQPWNTINDFKELVIKTNWFSGAAMRKVTCFVCSIHKCRCATLCIIFSLLSIEYPLSPLQGSWQGGGSIRKVAVVKQHKDDICSKDDRWKELFLPPQCRNIRKPLCRGVKEREGRGGGRHQGTERECVPVFRWKEAAKEVVLEGGKKLGDVCSRRFWKEFDGK